MAAYFNDDPDGFDALARYILTNPDNDPRLRQHPTPWAAAELSEMAREQGYVRADFKSLPRPPDMTWDEAVDQWLGECCSIHDDAYQPLTDLWCSYASWHERNFGFDLPVRSQSFWGWLKDRGVVKRHGLQLRDEPWRGRYRRCVVGLALGSRVRNS